MGIEGLFTSGSSRPAVLAVMASARTAGTYAPDCMLGPVMSPCNCFAFWFLFKGVFLKSTLRKKVWSSVYVNENKLFARGEAVQEKCSKRRMTDTGAAGTVRHR